MSPNSLTKLSLLAALAGLLPAAAMGQQIPKAIPMDPAGMPSDDPLTQQLGGGPDGPMGPGFDLNWYTIDGGGATYLTGGAFSLGSTAGQPDAGLLAGGDYELGGGFWYGALPNAPCYANCDQSTLSPILNVLDFICFQNKFAAGDTYANCDQSTLPPVLNVNDFSCFMNAYAAGCP